MGLKSSRVLPQMGTARQMFSRALSVLSSCTSDFKYQHRLSLMDIQHHASYDSKALFPKATQLSPPHPTGITEKIQIFLEYLQNTKINKCFGSFFPVTEEK